MQSAPPYSATRRPAGYKARTGRGRTTRSASVNGPARQSDHRLIPVIGAQSFYDSSWRLTNLVSPAGSFSYSYESLEPMLVGKITLPNFASIVNTHNQYDEFERLLST